MKNNYDKYEQDLLKSYDRDEWKSVKNVRNEINKYREYARNTLRKDKRINIRITSNDLENVQVIAIEEGIPYQTLIASIIHKFVTGRFIEKSR